MDYFATTIGDFSFKQIDKMTDESDLLQFEQLRFDYPLIFVRKEHSIIFFDMRIILDQIQYDFLYQLVKNATMQKEQKGLSPTELFKIIKCRHTREKSRNEKLTEYDRANERIRDIKRRIRDEIKKHYKKLIPQDNLNQLGIYEVKTNYGSDKYFNGSILIDSNSPYYYFDIDTAIDLLIINQRDKNKKYTTEFVFKK